MAKNKTIPTNASVKDFVSNVANETRRVDSLVLIELFKSITDCKPKMWGPSIIGFGKYHYQYASGHEGDARVSRIFSPERLAGNLYGA
jgi:hypothetical protein